MLVVAPYGRDAAVLLGLFAEARITGRSCADAETLVRALDQGAGAVVLTEEALTEGLLRLLEEHLEAQAPWSELPLVILAEDGLTENRLTEDELTENGLAVNGLAEASRRGGSRAGGRAAVAALVACTWASVLERPARPFTVVTAVRAALRARRRQYEVRDLHADLERRVEERTRQVRRLASTLTLAEQEERRRVSQLLHDDLQQMLFAIDLKLGVVRQGFRANDDEATLRVLDDAVARLRETGRLTRNLTVDLSPPILGSEGLRDALNWLTVQMKDLHGLAVEVEAEHAFRTPEEDMRVLLFQIVRELLFNVAKHAGTNEARVELKGRDHHIEITVADAGKGFDVEAAEARTEGERTEGEKPTGFGLFSVRERLGLFGGTMRIESAPGAGTRVVMDVPLRLE